MGSTLVQIGLSALIFLTQIPLSESARQNNKGNAVTRRDGTWAYVGCYTDSVGERTLTTNPGTPGGTGALTIELCQTACQNLGFVLAGVEYAGECYCGNTFSNGGGPAPDGTSGCSMLCNGNSSETCGGPNRLDIYDFNDAISTIAGAPTSTTSASSGSPSSPANWTSLGCYTDGVGGRTLGTQIFSIPGASMTVELCTAACLSAGFTLSGVEYADECYCDNALQHGGGPAPDGDAGCNMPCAGNTLETCGGPNRLNLYSDNGPPISATPTTSSAPTSTIIVATTLPSGWSSKGCWLDREFNVGRILAYSGPDTPSMTVEYCVQECVAAGYSVAGLEYYTQCFCDNYIINAGRKVADTDCNTPCGGNAAEECGGGDRMSIYSNETTVTVIPVPVPQETGLPGSWEYQGCLTDNAVARTFPYQLEFANNNTAENCLTQCAEFGYGAGGMEFGEQCFCGDAYNAVTAGATLVAASNCNMACTGDPSMLCGGSGTIQYYTWSGPALESWTFETGNDAGEYVFLIGGVIIPLIAAPAINGKVVFLEKFGTEPAANSTGAYELDLALLSNFTAAWRPMHVKSDVFCAASLTLPDKAGRQIDIGGWANQDTYGIRLYWPDGSPGVWGVNDWQENYAEVHLQAGRWYPSAMTMANGSILVMGGEEGSNGAPIPNLEVLPKPAGGYVLFCDYLNRTDPYNLYPFLTVLPTGGIFVAYYNEARILDEGTLETSKVLPNIPGAVNDFLGGRTYPFEGTSMLMPQHAPYTDPLTVMICGGSIPGPEFALDNCVSIQPELDSPTWTIERMPSKRVISSIAALPDGTYLIANGGQQGRAGFGLATQPNLNAVLYDPSKPLHNRMSVMANTTVARLYHSEAVLLQDGRVLISGSDPEDARFPQEYRVETFLPPYLLSGLTKPTFTISKTDLAYGETFSVTVNLFQGTTATMRVSLLAAVASTHGNSMGQRTIFPAVSCTGNVCQVTAPPNAHVSPPAWHMLFVLDGPTPSNAVWVRIGGDPAALGNWPDFPDFDLPGV